LIDIKPEAVLSDIIGLDETAGIIRSFFIDPDTDDYQLDGSAEAYRVHCEDVFHFFRQGRIPKDIGRVIGAAEVDILNHNLNPE